MTRHAANSIANWLIINRVSDLPQQQLSWSRQRRNAQPSNRLPWSYHLSRIDDKNTQFKTHHIERLVMVPCAAGATTKLKARQSLRDLRQSSSRLRFDALHHRSVFPLVKTFGFCRTFRHEKPPTSWRHHENACFAGYTKNSALFKC